MTNKYYTTQKIYVSAEKIYAFYTNVDNWKEWDSELEYSKLEGQFVEGSQGVLKPKGNSELVFTLINVKENIGFDQIMDLPLGSKFVLTRRIKVVDNYCEVTHSGYFEGFFGAIIGVFLKAKYTPLLEKSVLKLKELCEK